uniref:Magnetosome protein Mad25 n=1 Tax=bacterium ML-1 TaxID=1297055 RepID=M1RVF5_UNCXX|nr:magnetosome protein Mad25 [bacterium ML-1]
MPHTDSKSPAGARPEMDAPDGREFTGAGLSAERIAAGLDRLPWSREIQALKEGGATLDFEKIISEMAGIIQSMEAKLTDVLTINAHLESDLDHSKERIAVLKTQRDACRDALARKEEEAPSVREMQIVVEQLVEERNQAEQRIRELRHRNKLLEAELADHLEKVRELDEERTCRLNEFEQHQADSKAAQDRAGRAELRIAELEGQVGDNRQRIKDLESDLALILDDKLRIGKASRTPSSN